MQYPHPLTSADRPIARADCPPLGYGRGAKPIGAFELPVIAWKQVGISVVIGIGLGYVLFAAK